MTGPFLAGWTLAVLLGAWLWGSFLNQTVDRVSLPADGPTEPAARPTLLRPLHSVCLTCGRSIAAYDNLPVFSYLWLRGRCRHCGAEIGRRTLAVELVTPLLFVAAYWAGSQWAQHPVPAWPVWAVWAGMSGVIVGGVILWERRRPVWRDVAIAAAGLTVAALAGFAATRWFG